MRALEQAASKRFGEPRIGQLTAQAAARQAEYGRVIVDAFRAGRFGDGADPQWPRPALRPGSRSPPRDLNEYAHAGVDELFVRQIGRKQKKFFDTWAHELVPRFNH
jgi:hypothetical protein